MFPYFLNSLCFAYLFGLTMVLTLDNPWRMARMAGILSPLVDHLAALAHLLGFLVLAFLAFAARWPLPRWAVALVMVFYAAATELVQALLPHRTPELADWLQNLAGIAIGAAICWPGALLWRRLRGDRLPDGAQGTPPSDPWEVLLKTRDQQLPPKALGWWM